MTPEPFHVKQTFHFSQIDDGSDALRVRAENSLRERGCTAFTHHSQFRDQALLVSIGYVLESK